jgi:hypothetical protein
VNRTPTAAPRSILVGMGETAGYCGQLVAGFRELGLRADHLDLGPDRHAYSASPRPLRARLARWREGRRRAGPGPRVAWTILHRLTMVALLLHALVRYDAFVLRAGDSFLGLRDLPLLRRLGKHVVVVFFGSDSRPSYLNGVEVESGRTGSAAAAETGAKRRVVERIERHASTVVCHVMSAQLHRRPAVAFLELGIPRAIDPAPPPPETRAAGPLRVLHAPSTRHGKGTDVVREAVAAARRNGADVELVVVTGRPNREVLEAIAACDFVVDQVYSDTPMGGFAAEAAARGRPAVVGGYGWEELRRVTSASALPPSHLCHPDELAEGIARLATDHRYRQDLGDRARRFVETRWSPAAVARRFVALMTGEAPEEWTFDPASIDHVHGVGMSEPAVIDSIRAVLEAEGTPGLHVEDKPDLERRLAGLAAQG